MGEAVEDPKNQGRSRRFRWWHNVLALFAGALIWFYWPFLNPRWDQDRCEFGTVSNHQYREMLSAFQPRARAVIARIQDSGSEPSPKNSNISLLLTNFVREAVEGKDTPDEKVAAMHAAIRALGGWQVKSPSKSYHVTPKYIRYSYGISRLRISKMKTIQSNNIFVHIFSITQYIFPWADVKVDFSILGENKVDNVQHVLVFEWNIKYEPMSYKFDAVSCPSLFHHE